MADDNRLDLSADMEKLSADLLKDVKAATSEVKDRQAAIKAQELRDSDKAKTRRMQMLMVAVGAIVILLLSYWMVFAKSEDTDGTGGVVNSASGGQKPVVISAPATSTSAARSTNGSQAASQPNGNDSQVAGPSADEYDTPNGDGGM